MVGVDQFVGRWPCFRQNAQPAKGIDPLVLGQDPSGNTRPANSMEAVTTSNEIARHVVIPAFRPVVDGWSDAHEIANPDLPHFEQNAAPGSQTGVVQVFHELVL